MVFQVSSAKIAAASATKALARRAGGARNASALHLTAYDDFQNESSSSHPSNAARKAQLEASPELHQRAKKAAYHNMALVQPAVSKDSAAIEALMGNLLDGLSNKSAKEIQSASASSHKRDLSSGTVAEMLLLRKELLLLHQLLDTLH